MLWVTLLVLGQADLMYFHLRLPLEGYWELLWDLGFLCYLDYCCHLVLLGGIQLAVDCDSGCSQGLASPAC